MSKSHSAAWFLYIGLSLQLEIRTTYNYSQYYNHVPCHKILLYDLVWPCMVGTTYTYFVYKWNIIVFSFKHLLIHCNGFLIGQSCLNPGECVEWGSVSYRTYLTNYLSAYLSVWTWCCTLGSVQYLCVCQWRRKQFLNGGSIVFWMEKSTPTDLHW